MDATAQLSDAGLAARLASQVESLQEGFRGLARAATLRDMAARFDLFLQTIYPGADIAIMFRTGDAQAWERVSPGTTAGRTDTLPRPAGKQRASGIISETRTEIRCVQILADNSSLGLILTRGENDGTYSDVDLVCLRLFTQLFDNAHQSLLSRRSEKDLIFSLNHKILQLNSLVDTGIEVAQFNQDLAPERLALERAASITNASRGRVVIRTEGQTTVAHAFPSSDDVSVTDDPERRIASEFSFGGASYAFELFDKESRSGTIPFEETDQLLLDALARQVHASIENRYLQAQKLEKQRIEHDIAVAASIQQRILPASLPTVDGYDIAGINIPSKSVGGDYYDCMLLPDGKYACVMADVAGKGIPAALLVSSFHAYLTAYLESPLTLCDLARRLNRVICRAATNDKFITGVLGLLDPATGAMELLNAGHTPVYFVRANGSVDELSQGGVPFGMLDMDFPYQSERVTIEQGEKLFFYTDGITEAVNERGEFFDALVPLKDFVAGTKTADAGLFIRSLIEKLKEFTGAAAQSDDITALVISRRT